MDALDPVTYALTFAAIAFGVKCVIQTASISWPVYKDWRDEMRIRQHFHMHIKE